MALRRKDADTISTHSWLVEAAEDEPAVTEPTEEDAEYRYTYWSMNETTWRAYAEHKRLSGPQSTPRWETFLGSGTYHEPRKFYTLEDLVREMLITIQQHKRAQDKRTVYVRV